MRLKRRKTVFVGVAVLVCCVYEAVLTKVFVAEAVPGICPRRCAEGVWYINSRIGFCAENVCGGAAVCVAVWVFVNVSVYVKVVSRFPQKRRKVKTARPALALSGRVCL